MSPADQRIRTIVCLETGTHLFDRLSTYQATRPELNYRLIHWNTIPAEIFDLFYESSPAVLVVNDDFLRALFMTRFKAHLSSEHVRILAVADPSDSAGYEAFLRKGCFGVVKRDSSDQMFWKAIEAVLAGELWMPRAVLANIVRKSLPKSQSKLTRREAEILELITHGFKNQEIADRLFISRETVRWHIRVLYSKIGLQLRPRKLEGSETKPTDPLRRGPAASE
jgi:DNA-binding NarL/FixJ family response regulator